jgi:hypothetical protein
MVSHNSDEQREPDDPENYASDLDIGTMFRYRTIISTVDPPNSNMARNAPGLTYARGPYRPANDPIPMSSAATAE